MKEPIIETYAPENLQKKSLILRVKCKLNCFELVKERKTSVAVPITTIPRIQKI